MAPSSQMTPQIQKKCLFTCFYCIIREPFFRFE